MITPAGATILTRLRRMTCSYPRSCRQPCSDHRSRWGSLFESATGSFFPSAGALKEPVAGKPAVRALLERFLIPLHVFAEVGGLSVSIQWSPILGDRSDETNSAWTLELLGVTGASCRITWCSRRRWWAGQVVSEHHYNHQQIGGPLTFSDLQFSEDGITSDIATHLRKLQ